MTQDQADQLLKAVADLQQIGQALGMLLAQGVIWLQVSCILLCIAVFFVALRRQF